MPLNMPPEILALIDKPLSLIAVLFVGAVAGMLVEQVVSKQRREAWKQRNARRLRQGPAPVAVPPAADASDQMRHVLSAKFTKRPLLSPKEERVFRAAERTVAEIGKDWRVMAQVCLGEILSSPNEDAFRAINSKRVDILIVCSRSLPIAAIEYQGGGHYQKDAAARDAVKKEALRRAGIQYIEIKTGDRTSDLNWQIAKLVQSIEPRALQRA